MIYWEKGFFEEQNSENTRKKISEERREELLALQQKGLEIYTREDGYPDAREHIKTAEEIKALRIYEINNQLNSLNQDFAQAFAGEVIPNIEERKAEFVTLHNEIRELKGLQPREVLNENN